MIIFNYEEQFCIFWQSQYFRRSDVALQNIAKYFEKCSDEEMQHAKNFIEYQNKRGGTCCFKDIKVSYTYFQQIK